MRSNYNISRRPSVYRLYTSTLYKDSTLITLTVVYGRSFWWNLYMNMCGRQNVFVQTIMETLWSVYSDLFTCEKWIFIMKFTYIVCITYFILPVRLNGKNRKHFDKLILSSPCNKLGNSRLPYVNTLAVSSSYVQCCYRHTMGHPLEIYTGKRRPISTAIIMLKWFKDKYNHRRGKGYRNDYFVSALH